jgi:hypothetical protein
MRKERMMKAGERSCRKRGGATALLGAALILAAFGGGATSSQDAPPARAICVFTNPAFAGKCTEATDVAKGSSPAQACDAILQCLNNVDCLKTYCQATTVRSGWRLESARPSADTR